MLLLNSSALWSLKSLCPEVIQEQHVLCGGEQEKPDTLHSIKRFIQEVSQCRNSRSQLLCELYMDVFAELSPRGSLVIQETFT